MNKACKIHKKKQMFACKKKNVIKCRFFSPIFFFFFVLNFLGRYRELETRTMYAFIYMYFNRHIVALELLCSISSFAGFEKRGVKVVSLHFAQSYFCILTAGFKAYGIPNSS